LGVGLLLHTAHHAGRRENSFVINLPQVRCAENVCGENAGTDDSQDHRVCGCLAATGLGKT
jgi:hypothetical protein